VGRDEVVCGLCLKVGGAWEHLKGREGHAASQSGDFLLVCGGCSQTDGDPEFDCLHDILVRCFSISNSLARHPQLQKLAETQGSCLFAGQLC